jgi:breast cancer 2 susceptibility protein
MARADAILGGDSSKRHHSLYQEDKNGSIAMFTSAGGKRIDISEESMARVDAILGGDSPRRHNSLYQEGKNPSVSTFSFAGGKRIDVSEESMARADAILGGDSSWSHHALHQEDRNGLVSTFTSAGGKRIDVSEESMARADAILGGDSPKRHHALHHSDQDGSVSMFTSAGGESIDVSVESIATEVAVRDKGSPKWCNNESRRSEYYNNGTEVLLMRKGDFSSSVTPTQTPYHPVPLITHSFDMHVGRRSAYVNRHHQSLSYAPITPVPINFSLYTNTESLLSRSSFEGKAHQHINNTSFWFSPTGQKISLRDFADKYCPLARTADICVNTNLNKLLMDITSDNSHSVRFDMHGLPVCFHGHGASWNMKLKGSVSDFRRDLLNCGCDGSLISDIWISNHCRWIIWKLAAMERKFQSVLAGKYLTYLHVVNQLQKRFHVELVRASRPAIRKVLNRDVSASTCMILCVNKILDCKGQKGIRIVLTDGWYEVPAFIDEHLQKFIRKGKIVVGSKLLVCNAILEGADEGIDPLDTFYKGYVRSFAIRLKLFANCTRLCAWSSKLGFVKPSKTIVCRGGTFGIHRLNHIIPGGGPIPSIDLIICKRYPLLFLEETRNKSNPETVRRIISEAENAFIEDKFEDECSRLAEEFAENVQKGDNEVRFDYSYFHE